MQHLAICEDQIESLKEEYEKDGFLIINDFISEVDCSQLQKRANELIRQFNPGDVKTIFSSKHDQHAKHPYFLDSGDKIHFFFEEKAFDDEGNLRAAKELCINKIGHALHKYDDVFYQFSHLPHHTVLLNSLGIEHPVITQSMYICKQPEIGAEVQCHQDSTYLYVNHNTITGLWFALEDATIGNGCLWAIPGGHRSALKCRMLRNNKDEISTEVYDDSPWDLNKLVPLEVPKGSVIVLHGLVPHMSKENHSKLSRHAYSMHLMQRDDQFSHENWLRLLPGLSFDEI